MTHYTYLIVGGGMTADAAANGIRKVDETGTIGLISAEADAPYSRPPLSKGLWKGDAYESVWRGTENKHASLHLGVTVQSLDPTKKQANTVKGETFTYDKMLLATGGKPRRLPFGDDQIIYYRTLRDYNQLRELSEHNERFAVIGGGFIGSEVAAALATNGKRVTMLFPETGIGARVFPQDLAAFLNDYYRQKGVEVLANDQVNGLQLRGGQAVCELQSGREVVVDGVIAGIGIQPSVSLAQTAGMNVENGIVVDEQLRTSQPDIFAAGDVASFFNPALGKRIRVEHEDNALTMGEMAGANMANAVLGRPLSPYHHLPFFYSDLFDLGYEAVGELDSGLETVSDWQEPYRQGVVYYLKDGRVRGALLWNVWGQVDAARQLIAEPGPFTAEELKGRIS
jgi:NADPH-dependent 2,4-dienoyl-CoA reductase/sulfur reductase-like enzyme